MPGKEGVPFCPPAKDLSEDCEDVREVLTSKLKN